MATVYLHIGTPKTGTTSIQHLLAQNRKILESHNITYPNYGFVYSGVARKRNGHFLVRHLQAADDPHDPSNTSGDYQKGLALLEDTASHFDKIILSDEAIWNTSRLIPNFWTRLKADLEKRHISLCIIVYLRRQDLIMQSLYEHNIRHSNIFCSFPEYLESALSRENPFCLDYDSYLCELADLFGWESLIVRIFEKEQFCGPEGDLFSDFLQIFGLEMSDGFRMDKSVFNERLSNSHTEIRRILNRIPLPAGEEPLRSLRATHDIHLPGDGEAAFSWFEPETQREFLSRYAEGNSHLARICFKRTDGVLFQEPLQELPAFHVEDHELLTHTILSYGMALHALALANEEQRKELERLRDEISDLRGNSIWRRMKEKTAHLLKEKN